MNCLELTKRIRNYAYTVKRGDLAIAWDYLIAHQKGKVIVISLTVTYGLKTEKTIQELTKKFQQFKINCRQLNNKILLNIKEAEKLNLLLRLYSY